MTKSKQKISRKQEILQALAHMLEISAGSRITTAALAKQVGFSEAALYRHFPSKSKMFEGLIEFIEETIFTRINLILSEEELALPRLEKILSLLLTFTERNPGDHPNSNRRCANRRKRTPAQSRGSVLRSPGNSD